MRAANNPRKATLVNLAKGLVNDEFLYFFQPIVSLETGHITGAECLLRWKDASGEVRLPADFIAVSEESGFIAEIDKAMVSKVGAYLDQLTAEDERFYLTLNVAQSSLAQPDFADLLLQNLNAHGIDIDHLRLEITERIFFPGTEGIKTTINRLSELGFKLLLDDFGVGNSSVEYISKLPLVTLKLGHELVQKGPDDIEQFKIVRHLIGLGHQLDLSIIAEGVETAESLSLLASKGCTEVQGYLLARPMPFEQLLEMVKRRELLWDGYPFGLDYLAQIDHIDLRRDLVREVLILASTDDESMRQRSLKRIPNLEPRTCLFGHWYYGSARLRKINPEIYKQLGKSHEQFHKTCQKLLQTALKNPNMDEIRAIIEKMSEESRDVMSIAQKISTDALLDHFAQKKLSS